MGTFTWRVACAVGPQHLRGMCVPVIPRMLNVEFALTHKKQRICNKTEFFTTKYNECHLVIRELSKMHFYKEVQIAMIDSKQDAHPPNALDPLHLLHVGWETLPWDQEWTMAYQVMVTPGTIAHCFYYACNIHKPVLNDSQTVELFSIGNESESEDADADSQNIKIPSSSEVSGYVRAITSLCRVPERQRVNVQLYRQIGRFHC
ncbi:hypothetical protein T4A_4570 [Trichinella pseudospiralis]|uniref:Uncharacterized protein n=1 Tax=Trichinella pseudospiralis TaxID=6337 RepID=A0A0V1E7Y1_TRIPS|nr:hypothetical protein T4A_4570 [Trichinella pseudospiralis]